VKFNQIIADLSNKVYHPLYFLYGEEEYFIDRIIEQIEDHILTDAEKEFNLTVLYGLETDALSIESIAKRFPMMANYNVVVVKEAQHLRDMDKLLALVEQPSPSTVLVFSHKFKKPDGRSKFIKALKKKAVVFDSKKLYDNQVLPWIEEYVATAGYTIDPRAAMMLLEYVGTDLSKIHNELSKLFINLPEGTKITPKAIEENIGISKDYNVFELNDALGKLDVLKAHRIINHFAHNEKAYPIQLTLPALYRFFSQLLLYETVQHLPANVQASKLGVNPYFLKDYRQASKNFPRKKIARVMEALREADLHAKGIGNVSASSADILKVLVDKILL
jgi:DNA polymerase-3 subunit delta